MTIIKSIKCSMCHDILDKMCQKCSVCSTSYWFDWLAKSEIIKGTIWPKEWKDAAMVPVSPDIRFLIDNIKIKWKNFKRGWEFSDSQLKSVYEHENQWEYAYKQCQYCGDK